MTRNSFPSLRRTLALIGALILSGSALAAQQRAPGGPLSPAADELWRAAREAVALGDTSRAIQSLERLEKAAPLFAPGWFEHGKLLARTSNMGALDLLRRRKAADRVQKALDLDRDNPLYLLELARLRLKTPALRLDAERLFNRALRAAESRKDPAVLAEVNWELGQLHERRWASVAHRHILTGTAATLDLNAATNEWRYIPEFLASQTAPVPGAGETQRIRAEESYRRAVAADPSHEAAAASLLVLLYDTERFEEAARFGRIAVALQPVSARVHFGLGIALHRLDRLEEASKVLDSAFALLSETERREMTSLSALLTIPEAARYRSLDERERQLAEAAYWRMTDPVQLTAVNEARVEFLARVAYADLRYSSAEFGVVGWKTDRGIVHLRYGPPPVRATLAPETAESDAESLARVTTIWYYPETKLRFVFNGPPAFGIANFAGNFNAYQDNIRSITPARFDNVLARMQFDSIPLQAARFRGDAPGQTEVVVWAGVPTGRMLGDLDLSPALIEFGSGFTGAEGRDDGKLVRDSVRVRLDRAPREMVRRIVRRPAPGEYLARLEARQPDTGRGARGVLPVQVLARADTGFSLSDLVIARSVRPRAEGARRLADFDVAANPAMTLAVGDTLALFWENYGARPDAQGTSKLRIALTLTVLELDRGQGLFWKVIGGLYDLSGLSAKGDDQVVLTFDREFSGVGDRMPSYLTLELGTAPFARYRLAVTVTDLITGRSATTSRELWRPKPSS